MSEIRQLAAIMFTDIVGYSSLMGKDFQKTMELVRISKEIQKPLVQKHNGQWIKEMGDGVLTTFSSAVDAVNCAIEIQKVARRDFDGAFKIGIHSGDIIIEQGDVYGEGVNIASRIESVGVGNSILISSDVYFQIKNYPEIKTVNIGDFNFKNIERELTLYAISNKKLSIPLPTDMQGKGKIRTSSSILTNKNIKFLLITLFVLLCSGILYWASLHWPSNTVEEPPRGLIFATKVEANGQAIDPSNTFSENITDLYAVFRTNMTPPGMKVNVENPKEGAYYTYLQINDKASLSSFGWRWYKDGIVVNNHNMEVGAGKNFWLQRWNYDDEKGIFGEDLGSGTYTIVILIDGNPAMSADLIITPVAKELLPTEMDSIVKE
ncbi:adenylate/guanylate cyclase domain-containing protein [Maribacter antarcticus]|uniref:adenylate/guanylate cyclase domain-containing protein n=1 Tax=Maribacter antarcticus TaxID=505250 RepID=UPI00047DBEFB|nr:adenylate/guanylate cyclase domain-containing protein [Maribacter antarcticus]